MAITAAPKTKRNPQDLTLRNLHALKKRVLRLEGAVVELALQQQTFAIRLKQKR